ncbi:MAG: hypothetical protein HW389_2661, partial [Bacteroidetes bacterium]|nr:hypothetical protein [Bacteroidota bacterium]
APGNWLNRGGTKSMSAFLDRLLIGIAEIVGGVGSLDPTRSSDTSLLGSNNDPPFS